VSRLGKLSLRLLLVRLLVVAMLLLSVLLRLVMLGRGRRLAGVVLSRGRGAHLERQRPTLALRHALEGETGVLGVE
jgi:hypothetical protein